jgi:hypothetical protein
MLENEDLHGDARACHVCYSTTKNCINNDSYGIICVQCNACGRINPKTQKEDALKMWREKLEDELNFNQWHNDPEIRALQEQNRQANIEYFEAKIADLEASS